MIKKNQITVKQPELGQKILELRKAKGLTQEELVDRCNINVRTIQRIEAGEVTPRMFTIRTILEALGYDLDTIQFQETGEGEKAGSVNADLDAPMMKTAFVLGLVYFVIGFVETFIDMSVWGMAPSVPDQDFISITGYLLLKLVICATFGGFMFGFYRITSQHPNAWIKVSSLMLAGLTLVSTAVDSYSFYVGEAHLYFLPVQSVMFGMVYIFFGFGLLKYRSVFGEIAFFGGLLGMTAGICFLTVVLFLPGLILIAVFEIISLILLYKTFERSPGKVSLA